MWQRVGNDYAWKRTPSALTLSDVGEYRCLLELPSSTTSVTKKEIAVSSSSVSLVVVFVVVVVVVAVDAAAE